MAEEILKSNDVLGGLVVLGGLSCSEVMAHDTKTMLLVEPAQTHGPFVCWIVSWSRWKHNSGFRCFYLLHVPFNGIENNLANRD